MTAPTKDPRVVSYGERLFWDRVVVAGSGCWLWDGTTNGHGYGQVSGRIDGKGTTIQAHRVAYEMFVGPVPDGLEIDHLCRVRQCVRPDHLEAVTRLVNQRRANDVNGERRLKRKLLARGDAEAIAIGNRLFGEGWQGWAS